MTNKNKQILYYSIGAVLFIAIIIIMFWSVRKSPNAVSIDDQNQVEQVIPTEDTSVGSVHVVNSRAAISYADALKKYKDARIQLDEKCQASPNNVTYKNNSSMMIDNRAPVSRNIKVDTNYSIKAYSFKIIKLSSTTLPMKWFIDCGTSQNVATILLQK